MVRFINKSYVLPQTGQVHSCFNSCFDRRCYRSLRTMFLSELFLATSKPFHVLQSSQQQRFFSVSPTSCDVSRPIHQPRACCVRKTLSLKRICSVSRAMRTCGSAWVERGNGKSPILHSRCLKMGYTTYPQMAILMGNMIIIQWIYRYTIFRQTQVDYLKVCDFNLQRRSQY